MEKLLEERVLTSGSILFVYLFKGLSGDILILAELFGEFLFDLLNLFFIGYILTDFILNIMEHFLQYDYWNFKPFLRIREVKVFSMEQLQLRILFNQLNMIQL